jgi:S-adenosylmethionine:tRNA ribosyltransferase-isomerase
LGKTILKGLEKYFFELPISLIAQEPSLRRGDSRLLVLHKDTGEMDISSFNRLHEFLPKQALLVFNNAKVTPARLFGISSGKPVEVLVLEPELFQDTLGNVSCWCMVRPGKLLPVGSIVRFRGYRKFVKAEVIDIDKNGRRHITFHFRGKASQIFEKIGHIPLPPYIKRPDNMEDSFRYQTVFANKEGAVAAPTAGLHFTHNYLDFLSEQGFEMAMLFLKVGMGTFSTLRDEQLRDGKLHEEYVEINEVCANRINMAKKAGRPIVSVGTTTLRALEWAGEKGELKEISGMTDIFIRPGHKFMMADALVTNFHLPCSSLFMLVCAFGGINKVQDAYKLAVSEKFKFFSYGDAMLII